MKLAQHILVATDFSEPSNLAVDAAATLASLAGARATLFHSFDPDPLAPPVGINMQRIEAEIEREMTEAVRTRLGEIRREQFAAVADVAIAIKAEGNAAHAICDYATKHGVDLIVVGTQGRSGLAHLLIGSVAERVVRHAHCPVLAMRPTDG